MKVISIIKNGLTGLYRLKPAADEAEIDILGIRIKLKRTSCSSVPHEFSIFVPRLEITKRITEGNKTTQDSLILNSVTIVSAPRHELSGRPAKLPNK